MNRKTQHKWILVVGISMLMIGYSYGQQRQARNTDTLREAVRRLEATRIDDKPDLLQMLHKRTLLSAYNKLQESMRADIALLEEMKTNAAAVGADTDKEIAHQLQKMNGERTSTSEKIQILTAHLQDIVAPTGRTESAAASVAATSVAAVADGNTAATTTTTAPHISPVVFSRPRSAASLSGADTTPVGSETSAISTSAVAAPTPTPSPTSAVLCGQLKLASLTQTFSVIKSDSRLVETQKRANQLDVQRSTLADNCQTDGKTSKDVPLTPGTQKDAVVDTLKTLLNELKKIDDAPRGRDENYYGPKFKSLSRETIRKQILLLQEYIGNVTVYIEDNSGNLIATPMTNADGNFEVTILPKDGKFASYYLVSTEADNQHTKRKIVIEGNKSLRVNIPIEDRPVSLLTRAVVGYEQSGAASARREQDYFFDLFVSSTFPLSQKINPDFGERFRTWGAYRIASIPQSGESSLGAFASGFSTNVSGLRVRDVARVFDFLGGVEYRLTGNDALLPSFARDTRQKFSVSLIASFGAVTPTSPLDSITTFRVSPDAPGLPPAARGKEFVAFVQSDRDRFFRQYYGGARIQGFFFTKHNMPIQRFPLQLDMTIGQSEFVTAGRLRGAVTRFDGYFPLPYNQLSFLNLYGTAQLRLTRANTGIPLVLQLAPDGTTVPAANVALVELPQPNRDFYKIGVGIDFIEFVKKISQATGK